MEYREIEVTLISAQKLKKVNAFGKMTVYGVAWIYPSMPVSSPMDSRGNLNPTWNATLKLIADERLVQDGNAIVHIDHSFFGNKCVGSSSISLSGAKQEGSSGSSSSNFMTVPVVRPSGKARGSLNMSVKVGELIEHPQQPPPYTPAQDACGGAYPPGYGASYYPYAGYASPPPPRRS